MKRFVVLAMLLVVVSMSSCIKWKCCINGDFVQVYKTKGDYTNNAYVLKTTFTATMTMSTPRYFPCRCMEAIIFITKCRPMPRFFPSVQRNTMKT